MEYAGGLFGSIPAEAQRDHQQAGWTEQFGKDAERPLPAVRCHVHPHGTQQYQTDRTGARARAEFADPAARRSAREPRPGYDRSKWPRSCRFDDWNASVVSLGPDRRNCNNARVQPSGACHYHGLPEGLINRLGVGADGATDMIAGGFAADGFPFYLRYGYRDPDNPESGLVAVRGSWMLWPGTRLCTRSWHIVTHRLH